MECQVNIIGHLYNKIIVFKITIKWKEYNMGKLIEGLREKKEKYRIFGNVRLF